MAKQLQMVIRTARPLLLAGVVLALVLGVWACGGDGDEDPQEVLEQTFSNEERTESGVFDLQLEIEAEGGDQPGTLEASLGGPFESPEGELPRFDVEARIEAGGEQGEFTFEGGLASDGTSAFVNFQGTEYVVPQELFDQFATSFIQLQEQGDQQADRGRGLLGGIDPTTWLTELDNEGTEDVEGAETIHVSGKADVPALVEDLRTLAKRAGRASGQLDTGALDQLDETVRSAEVDVFSGADDRRLRRFEATLDLAPPPDTPGAPESVVVGLVLTLSELDEEQTIETPADAQPLRILLEQLGVDPASIGVKGSPKGGVRGLPQAGGPPSGPSDDASAAYLDCLRTARGPEAVQACAEELAQ